MANGCLSLANKQEQDRAHQQASDENANRNEYAKLRKTHGATQYERKKANRCRQRAKENRATKFCHRGGNGLLMRFSIGASLVIASNGENCEIDAEPDKDGAEADADHAQSSKEELSKRQRNQTRDEETKRHAHEGQPSPKTRKKNCTYQHD